MQRKVLVAAVVLLLSVSAFAVYSRGAPRNPYQRTPVDDIARQPVSPPQPQPQPVAEPSKPKTPAEQFPCHGQATMRERVKCRINAAEEGGSGGYEGYGGRGGGGLYYFPEECRALTEGKQQACVDGYEAVVGCFNKPSDSARSRCAKERIGLGDVRADRVACGSDAQCLEKLRENVFALAKFRFYNLEERVRSELHALDERLVIDFVTAVEQEKINFNDAATVEEKKSVVLRVNRLWNDVKQQAGALGRELVG